MVGKISRDAELICADSVVRSCRSKLSERGSRACSCRDCPQREEERGGGEERKKRIKRMRRRKKLAGSLEMG